MDLKSSGFLNSILTTLLVLSNKLEENIPLNFADLQERIPLCNGSDFKNFIL